jgi:hypothetical protein
MRHQVVVDRTVAVDHHFRKQRAGIDQDVDQTNSPASSSIERNLFDAMCV